MGSVVKSGAVTGVGVAYLAVGALVLLFGVAILVGGAAIGALLFGGTSAASKEAIKKIEDDPNLTSDQKKKAKEDLEKLAQAAGAAGGGVMAMLGGILGVCVMLLGLPPLLGGIGVLQRKQWGRILTIIWAFVFILFGVLGLWGLVVAFTLPGLITTAIYLGLGIWAVAVLLNSQYAAEFNVPRA
jgi:hypothetical protein